MLEQGMIIETYFDPTNSTQPMGKMQLVKKIENVSMLECWWASWADGWKPFRVFPVLVNPAIYE